VAPGMDYLVFWTDINLMDMTGHPSKNDDPCCGE